MGDENFAYGFKEIIDANPSVSDDAGGGTGRFENACGWGKAITGHAFAADVEDGFGSAVERIVIARVNVAEVFDVRGHRFVLPAIPAQDEAFLRHLRGDVEEEFFDA